MRHEAQAMGQNNQHVQPVAQLAASAVAESLAPD